MGNCLPFEKSNIMLYLEHGRYKSLAKLFKIFDTRELNTLLKRMLIRTNYKLLETTMTKKIILGLAIAIGVIGSVNAAAAADDKYPAANFEPSVIYMDKDIAPQAPKDDKYPAANFEPKVIYQNSEVSSGISDQAAEQYDPKYPAAYFQPRVIYP
jgi:hypothetical protein